MGGEQYSVLVYGPKNTHSLIEWIEKFKLIDKKKWVKNYLNNEKHNYKEGYDTDDEEGIDIVFEQEFVTEFDILTEFLNKHNLTIVFLDNCDWEEFGIGFYVEDYDKMNQKNKEYVKMFCEKHNLKIPTFYAGIQGEFE